MEDWLLLLLDTVFPFKKKLNVEVIETIRE